MQRTVMIRAHNDRRQGGTSMDQPVSLRRRGLMLAAAAAALPRARAQAQGAAAGGVLNVAMSSEPGPLDPTPVTSDMLSTITQHFFETLYIFGPDYSIAPLLASALPEISDGGKGYVIRLRRDVPYHDGGTMTVDDVFSSLQRWGRLSPRGRLAVDQFWTSISAVDSDTLQIVLKQPYSPFLNLLAFPNGSPVIMPKRVATAADPLKEFVGTGPYKLIEHKPDTWVRVRQVRADTFPRRGVERLSRQTRSAGGRDPLHSGAEPDHAGGRADGRPVSLGRQSDPGELRPPEGSDGRRARRADRGQLAAVHHEHQKGRAQQHACFAELCRRRSTAPTRWRPRTATNRCGNWKARSIRRERPGSIAAAPGYNQGNADKAASLLKQAGYNGEPVRVLTSVQYDYQYKIAQVTQANFTDAGFKIDLQVTDWATILQRRQKSRSVGRVRDRARGRAGAVVDHGVQSELSWLVGHAGQARRARGVRHRERSGQTRAAVVQTPGAVLQRGANRKLGAGYTTYGASRKISGYYPGIWPYFLNTKLTGQRIVSRSGRHSKSSATPAASSR